MKNTIKEDDKKFNDLVVKQHPDVNSFCKFERSKKLVDLIEEDDIKMEELLNLQSTSELKSVEPVSIEEKWEERIILQNIFNEIDYAIKNVRDIDKRDDEGLTK